MPTCQKDRIPANKKGSQTELYSEPQISSLLQRLVGFSFFLDCSDATIDHNPKIPVFDTQDLPDLRLTLHLDG